MEASLEDGRYSYHELAQTLFSRHLLQRSRKEYYITRKALVDFYQRILEKTQTEVDQIVHHTTVQGREVFYSTEWVELAMAIAYQLFLLPDEASHNRAIEQVLNTYEHTEHTEEIVRGLRKLSQKQPNTLVGPNIQQAIELLLRYIEADQQKNKQELLATADSLLKSVIHKPSFSSKLLSYIYRKRGFAYRSLSEFQHAIADYNRAIELDSSYARAYASEAALIGCLRNTHKL